MNGKYKKGPKNVFTNSESCGSKKKQVPTSALRCLCKFGQVELNLSCQDSIAVLHARFLLLFIAQTSETTF